MNTMGDDDLHDGQQCVMVVCDGFRIASPAKTRKARMPHLNI